jgi:hypothetical protein
MKVLSLIIVLLIFVMTPAALYFNGDVEALYLNGYATKAYLGGTLVWQSAPIIYTQTTNTQGFEDWEYYNTVGGVSFTNQNWVGHNIWSRGDGNYIGYTGSTNRSLTLVRMIPGSWLITPKITNETGRAITLNYQAKLISSTTLTKMGVYYSTNEAPDHNAIFTSPDWVLATNQMVGASAPTTWSGYTNYIPAGITNLFVAFTASNTSYFMSLDVVKIIKYTDGSAGWWKFDGNALDSSGNNRDATLFNAPTYVAGKVGQSLYLNGTNQYAQMGAASLYVSAIDTACTMTAWVMVNRTAAGTIMTAFRQSGYSVGMGIGVARAASSGVSENTGYLQGHFRDNANLFNRIEYAVSAVDGAFHHVAFSVSGTNGSLYVDGVLRATTTAINVSNTISSSANSAEIGAAGGATFFQGAVDEARIYNLALSSNDVHTMWNENKNNIVN